MKKVAQQAKEVASDDKKKQMANLYNDPLVGCSSVVLKAHKLNDDLLVEMIADMGDRLLSFNKDERNAVEELLLPQAHALQAIFEKAALKMFNSEYVNGVEAWASVALKAQDQCRKTLATLAEIRNPKQVAFIRQQNNAINQQVNNSGQIKSSENFSKSANELLIGGDNAALDVGRADQAIAVNSQLETVGAIHGSGDLRRTKQK